MGITNAALEANVRDLVGWSRSQETQVARAMSAQWAMKVLADVQAELSTVRIEAVRSLWTEGWSLKDISEALEISRARVHQIVEK